MEQGSFGLAGQGWLQIGELALAFVLSALVGLEREVRRKAAGLRTYSLVGVSAALFMLISKHGFDNVLEAGRVVLDPSRIAAQVVSGIGFIGGGVIFMRRNVVRGLTTAATVWLTAALGMACGAGLPVLAIAATAGHFLIMLAVPRVAARWLPQGRRTPGRLRVLYSEHHGRLRGILLACSELGFAIDRIEIGRAGGGLAGDEARDWAGLEAAAQAPGEVSLLMEVRGRKPVTDLLARLGGIEGVTLVSTLDDDALD